MKLIKGMVALQCEDIDPIIIKRYEVEGWIAEGTGLACTPYEKELIVSLRTCKTWILTHIESGMAVGSAFPSDKQYAKIWLEEIARENLDFNQNRWQITAKKEAIVRQLGIALKRTKARWAITQTEQLTLF